MKEYPMSVKDIHSGCVDEQVISGDHRPSLLNGKDIFCSRYETEYIQH